MELGFVGLGKMGLNMVKRLLQGGHRIVGTAKTAGKKSELLELGAEWADSYEELVKALQPPRHVWIMVPSGETTEEVLRLFQKLLSPGDLLVDGGNSDYRDTTRRAELFRPHGIEFLDSGTSGGIWGLANGYCLMVGGSAAGVKRMSPVLTTLAPPQGWEHLGDCGAGHYVKMVHNAIEYGMMQAYAEGFELLEKSGHNLNLQRVAELWNRGSVVRSWLLELSETIFSEDPHLKSLKGYVEDSGECRWAVETAIAKSVPAPVLATSLFTRFASRQTDGFSLKYLAALRNQFGGHAVKKTEDPST
jgi:6-phosphogluconate dehydrogenase